MSGSNLAEVIQSIESGTDIVSLTKQFSWEELAAAMLSMVPAHVKPEDAAEYLFDTYGQIAVDAARVFYPGITAEAITLNQDIGKEESSEDAGYDLGRVPKHRMVHLSPFYEKCEDTKHAFDKKKSNRRKHDPHYRPKPEVGSQLGCIYPIGNEYDLLPRGSLPEVPNHKGVVWFAVTLRDVVEGIVPKEDDRIAIASAVYYEGLERASSTGRYPSEDFLRQRVVQEYDKWFLQSRGNIPISASDDTHFKPLSNTLYATSTTALWGAGWKDKPSVMAVGEDGLVPAFQQEGGFHDLND